MAFLRINGFTIPVADPGSTGSLIEIGSRSRAIDGASISDIRAVKRSQKLKTSPLNEMVLEAIRGSILGTGQIFPYDTFTDDPETGAGLYSAGGLSPVTGQGVGAIRFGTGTGDGDPVVDSLGNTESKYGSGSLSVDPATTNLLNTNSAAAESAPTGYTNIATAALSADTNNFLQGVQSLDIESNAVNDGADTVSVTASASTDYVAAVYVKVPSARTIRVGLINQVPTNFASTEFTLSADEWTRLEVTGNSPVGTTSIKIRITDKGTTGFPFDFFVDALQLEAGTVANSWRNPEDSARVAGDLAYPSSIVTGATDLTVNVWVRLALAGPTANKVVIEIEQDISGGPNQFRLVRAASTDHIQFATSDPAGSVDNLNATAPGWDGDWHMLTGVLRKNPEGSEDIKEIYWDGVSIATGNPTDKVPVFSSVDSIRVGNQTGGTRSPWGPEGLIDDLLIVPYAATASLVSAWFAMAKAMPALPRVYIDGDIIPDDQLLKLFRGLITSETFVSAAVSGAFRNNARQLEFTLEAV